LLLLFSGGIWMVAKSQLPNQEVLTALVEQAFALEEQALGIVE
jgi:hypothetical protein